MNVGPITQTEKGPRLPITINTMVYDFTLPAAETLALTILARLGKSAPQPAAATMPTAYPDLSPLARSTLANAHNIFELQRRQPSINELAKLVEMEPRTFVDACMEELRTAGWVRKRPSKSTSKDAWDWRNGRRLQPADVPLDHKYETAEDAIMDLVTIFGKDRLIEIIQNMED